MVALKSSFLVLDQSPSSFLVQISCQMVHWNSLSLADDENASSLFHNFFAVATRSIWLLSLSMLPLQNPVFFLLLIRSQALIDYYFIHCYSWFGSLESKLSSNSSVFIFCPPLIIQLRDVLPEMDKKCLKGAGNEPSTSWSRDNSSSHLTSTAAYFWWK